MTDNPRSSFMVRYSQEDLRSLIYTYLKSKCIIIADKSPGDMVKEYSFEIKEYIKHLKYAGIGIASNIEITSVDVLNSKYDIDRAIMRILSELRLEERGINNDNM